MNKKFLSAILFGALMVSSTGTFVSCKDYDDDIDQINQKLDGVEATVADLQKKIGDGAFVKSITPTADGFTVTMSDGSSTTITGIKGDKGEAGKDGAEWTIIDGYWACNGEKTTVKAEAVDGKDGQKEVEKREDGWYLWNGTAFEKVTVDTPAVVGVPYYQEDATDPNYIVMHIFDANGKDEQTVRLPMTEGLAQIAMLSNKDLTIYYSIATADKALQAWEGPKGAPAKGDYMITYSDDSLMVQVAPNNYDLSKTALKLVNSKNEEAPVTLGAAVAYEGLYTRAAVSANGLYQIPFSIETITDEIVKAYSEVDGKRPALALVASDKVRSTYETSLIIEKPESIDSWSFYINKKNNTPNNRIEPGKTGTLKVNGENADKLYDAFLTMDTKTYANAKADSIKYGIKTDGLTISCSANAKYSLPFVVHTLDVTGKIMKTEGVYVQFSEEAAESTITLAEQAHIATAKVEDQKLVVDLAAYFDKMSEADRILWNADARMLLNNTNVSFVYTDESTGKEETVDVVSGLIAGFTKLKKDGKTEATNNADIAKLGINFVNNYGEIMLGNGVYTAKITVEINGENGTKETQTIVIPFTIANPTTAEITSQYTFDPAFYANGVLTVIDGTSIDLSTMISVKDGAAIDYTGLKAAKELTVSRTVLTMGADAKANTAYDVKGLKVTYLGGRSYDMPAFKVKFVDSKTYIADMAKASFSLVSGNAEDANSDKVFYAEKADSKAGIVNFYKVTNAGGKFVADDKVVVVGFDALVDGTDKTFASDLIKVEVSEKNDIVVTAQKRITVDTNVVVPVKLTVTNADGTNATVYASFTVTVKAYPVQ